MVERDEILRANRRLYDSMAASNSPLCRPAKDDELVHPLHTVDASGWLGDSISGRRVLCLAAGGGRQSALYAAAGAEVTVVDLSPAMLELDRTVAAERGLSMRLIQASMDDLSMLQPAEFDIVIHPVSTCYIDCIKTVFLQVARVLQPNGLYISQHKQPTSLQASTSPMAGGGYAIFERYYRRAAGRNIPIPPSTRNSGAARRLREPGGIEFLHRWEELIGDMCRAGFVIEDLVEPLHAEKEPEPASFADRAGYIAPYVRIKARRRSDCVSATPSSTLWLPKH